MAGLGECCFHVASVLFYIEVWTRLHGKLACTQVKCTWILPTYVKEVQYDKAKNINFTSAKKLKDNLDESVENLEVSKYSTPRPGKQRKQKLDPPRPHKDEIKNLYACLDKCKIKPVCLSLVDPYSNAFVIESNEIPTVPDLFKEHYMDLTYPELFQEMLEDRYKIE